MATNEEMRELLDHLQPIFPQVSAYFLLNCIQETRARIGDDGAAVLRECINLLLSGINQDERPDLIETAVKSPEIDDDIICMGSTTRENTNEPCIFIDDDDDDSKQSRNLPMELVEAVTTDTLPSRTQIFTPTKKPFLMDTSTDIFVRTQSCPQSSTNKRNFSMPGSTNSRSLETESTRSVQTNMPSFPEESKNNQLAFLNAVKSLFPQIDNDYLKKLETNYSSLPYITAVQTACDHLLEMKDFPKKRAVGTSECSSAASAKSKSDIDYFKDFSSFLPWDCRKQCEQVLLNDFPMISTKDIRRAMLKFNHHYAPTRKFLEETLIALGSTPNSSSVGNSSSPMPSSQTEISQQRTPVKYEQGVNDSFRNSSGSQSPGTLNQRPSLHSLTFLKRKRNLQKIFEPLDLQLQQEINFFAAYKLLKSEEDDRKIAFLMNEQEYEEEGQKIECGCCFGEVVFEEMVQCLDGHLFCVDCLKNYAKEAVYGSGKATLSCMTSDCETTFPISQLKKALPTHILIKYEDRLQEESLLLAEMEDLVRCPACDFAAILPSEDKVFKCQMCGKETCRFCKEEWSEHFGLKCNEIEKKNVRDVRLSYEEKMTMAKIRKCTKCGCEFTKSDGCNKMTCRCGTTQCYVCRQPNIHYKHFCEHPKDPGKSCRKCQKCSLWSDPSEDDDRAVKELEKEAENAKRQLNADGDSLTTSPSAKKPRLSGLYIEDI